MLRMIRAMILFGCLTAANTTAAPPVKTLTPQQVAQIRADWMVKHNHRWHPPFSVGRVFAHCRFEGVGWGRAGLAHKRMGTCRPRWRMTLVGDAYATNGRMSARVRLWR